MTAKNLKSLSKAIVGRELVKLALRPLLKWDVMDSPQPGFSIVLGVPWHLRHLLNVNLDFVSRTDLSGLHKIHVVFDRRSRPEMDELRADAQRRFTDLPLSFHHYPAAAGKIIESVNVSTFYNSMNCATALAVVETQYVVMHDFDLFPVVEPYFQEVIGRMRRDGLRFCGVQRTHFDGLRPEDEILGTWCLGIDAAWLRENYRPIDIFHRVETVRGEWVTLDPFSSIQRRTPERSLVETLGLTDFCHVGNLCATYMRYRSGQKVRFNWKLHYLFYLEALNGNDLLQEITDAMEATDDGILSLPSGFQEDFSAVDPTCANVLRDEVERMDTFMHGTFRPHVARFVDAFQAFLARARGDAVRQPESA